MEKEVVADARSRRPAMLLEAAIRLGREFADKPAGLRTYMLVVLGHVVVGYPDANLDNTLL